MTEIEDEKVRKDDILSNRDKAQRKPGRSLDGRGVQVDEYKDNPANHHSSNRDLAQPDVEAATKEPATPSPKTK